MKTNKEEIHDYWDNHMKQKEIPKIRVIVRKRPCSKKEIQKNDIDIIERRGNNTIIVKELKNKVDLTKYVEEHHYTFDMAYDENATNELIYLDTVKPMVEAAFDGAKVTCFAYGQTGSGKTYSMMGANTTPGLFLLSSYDIFAHLQEARFSHLTIWVSFYEIYCNKLFDLLNDRNVLQAREDGRQNICIVGLVEKPVYDLKTLMSIIDYGLKVRTTGVTGANMDSSRSHAILQIEIRDTSGNQHGKISFIDLAGSERAVDTIDTNKQTKIDGAEINKSLLALKECIRALDQEKKHTPFRGSKLTLVLRDSFMGNCKTLMIANISPCLSCSEHTLNTLRYADRVKELRKDKGDTVPITNVKSDPSEMLANMLMMPRQHSKTVKYTVDLKKQEIANKNSLAKKGTSVVHINELLQGNTQRRSVPMSTKQTQNQRSSGGVNHNNNNNNNYNNPNNIQSNYNHLLENLTSSRPQSNNNYTEAQSELYVSKFKNLVIRSDTEHQKYSNIHESLISEILKGEENLIKDHKESIDEIVDNIKEQMALINEVDRPGSVIEDYTSSLDRLLGSIIEKTSVLRKKVKNFNNMLKDEEELSSKFMEYEDLNENYILNKNNIFDTKSEEDILSIDIKKLSPSYK